MQWARFKSRKIGTLSAPETAQRKMSGYVINPKSAYKTQKNMQILNFICTKYEAEQNM